MEIITLDRTEGAVPNDIQLAKINGFSLIAFNPNEVHVYTATITFNAIGAEKIKTIARSLPGRAIWMEREPVGRWFELLELSPTQQTLKARFYVPIGRTAEFFADAVSHDSLRWNSVPIRDLPIDCETVTNAWRRRLCA